MKNSSRFINAFAKIESECRRIVGEGRYTKFYILLQQASKLNKTVKRYEIEIQEFADLRNAIIHERTDEGEVIAEPVDWVVEKIEKIAELLCAPSLLQDHFLKPVKTCRPIDSTIEVYKTMKQMETSKMPIYEGHEFIGLLTLEMIADTYILQERMDREICVQDVFKPQFRKEKVLFLSKRSSLLEALQCFEDSMAKGKILLAIIISENGRKEERPLGIITIADLPYLMKIVD